jgi:(p)ppGpp synthase/HD superfamily hydrolase
MVTPPLGPRFDAAFALARDLHATQRRKNTEIPYVAHLSDPALPDGALRVSLADKVHNARAILFDLRAGHDVYSRFSAPREEQLWYYGALAAAFAELTDSPMVPELQRVVDELRAS